MESAAAAGSSQSNISRIYIWKRQNEALKKHYIKQKTNDKQNTKYITTTFLNQILASNIHQNYHEKKYN